MKLSKKYLKLLQTLLSEKFNTKLTIDGIIGKKSINLIDKMAFGNTGWTLDRLCVATLQFLVTSKGFNSGMIDGLLGPQTDSAIEFCYDSIFTKSAWERPNEKTPSFSTVNAHSVVTWPNSKIENDIIAFFGEPGTRLSKVNSPYPLRLAWDTDVVVNRFTAHDLIVEPTERVLDKVLGHYGIDEIKRLKLDLWGGCLNHRKIRGGSRLSSHSWGISIDWNPVDNRLRWKATKASFSKPEYDFWWSCWEAEGATSLGRKRDFDWMHVEFLK